VVRIDANDVMVDGDGTVSMDLADAAIAVLLPLDQANVREGSTTECAALTTTVGPATATTPAAAP